MIFLLAILFLLAPSAAEAVTRYAAASGGVTSNCSQTLSVSTPGTFTFTASCMSAGDRIELRGGTYTSFPTLTSGTSDSNRSVVASYQNETVTFNDTGGNYAAAWTYDTNLQYVSFIGGCTTGVSRTCRMIFTGHDLSFNNSGTPAQHLIFDGIQIVSVGVANNIQSGGFHNTFRNCRINNGVGYGAYVNGNADLTIENCEFDGFDGYAIHTFGSNSGFAGNIYRWNVFHGNGAGVGGGGGGGATVNAILVGATCNGCEVYGNIIYDHNLTVNVGAGIRAAYGASNTKIYNNTIYMSGRSPASDHSCIDVGSGGAGATSTTVRNNICHNTTDPVLDIGTSTVFSNNLAGSADTGISLTETASTTFVTPGSNFHLKSTSAANNAGTNTGNPAGNTVDFDGVTRTAPFDLGAYEGSLSFAVTITTTNSTSCNATMAASNASCTISGTANNTLTITGTSGQTGGSTAWSSLNSRVTGTQAFAGSVNAWTTDTLTLKAGINVITVSGTDGVGTIESDTISITYVPTFPGNSRVGAWGFEDGSGTTATDSSGSGNTGTLVGGVSWTTAGRFRKALTFNGTTGYVGVADNNTLDMTQSFTISAWVKPAASHTDFRAILNKNTLGPYGLYATVTGFCGNGTPSGFFTANGVSGPAYGSCHTTPLQVGVWTHLAVTYDGTNFKFYKNGVLLSSTLYVAGASSGTTTLVSPQGYIEQSTGTLQIGSSEFDEFFHGDLDEVRLYNFAIPLSGTLNTAPNGSCSATEANTASTASVIGDMNCPIVALAPPIDVKIGASSTFKIGAGSQFKIGTVPP